nr:PREDICTED: ribosyldihydronicotinamide dehydrogenase [quinone] isoform X2 [Rhinolophus sinicus]
MAGKKVLIVYAHQEPRSFNGSLKKVAVDELREQGCTVIVSDLYAMDFEPRATRKDITGALSNPEFFSYGVEAYEACKKGALTSDIIDEQKKVQEADLVIFQVGHRDCCHRAGVQQSFLVPSCLLGSQHKGTVRGGHRATCNSYEDRCQLCPTPPHRHCTAHCMLQSKREEMSLLVLPHGLHSPAQSPEKRTAGFLLSLQID